MRFVDHAAVAGVLRMETLIPAMRQAMLDFSAGRVAQPPRRIIGMACQDLAAARLVYETLEKDG